MLSVGYCHQPMSIARCASSVVRHQRFALNIICSKITGHRALIFGMKHCLGDLYQVCSKVPLGSKMALQMGVLGSKIKYT